MPIITAIKPQKNQKRVNIYIDDKFRFGIDLENFVMLHLKIDQELTEEEIENVVTKADFQKALNRLLRFATLRPRSQKEILDWLKRKEISPEFFPKLLDKLSTLELLDDKKFAQWWIDQRIQFKYKSKREIQFELIHKGIDRKLVDLLVTESLGPDKEYEMVKILLEKKSIRWAKLPRLERKKKMLEFLARKGFSWNIIRSVIDEILQSD